MYGYSDDTQLSFFFLLLQVYKLYKHLPSVYVIDEYKFMWLLQVISICDFFAGR